MTTAILESEERRAIGPLAEIRLNLGHRLENMFWAIEQGTKVTVNVVCGERRFTGIELSRSHFYARKQDGRVIAFWITRQDEPTMVWPDGAFSTNESVLLITEMHVPADYV